MSPRISRFTITLCFLLSISALAFGQKPSLEADLKGADGHPPKSAQVRVESVDKKSKAVVVKADASGHASVGKLDAGSYRVTAIVEGKVQSSQNVKVEANKPAVVSFKTPAASTTTVAANGAKTKIVGQKRYVWVPGQTGSRFGGYWKEAGTVNKPAETGASAVDVGGEGAADSMQRQGRSGAPTAAGGH